MRVITSWLSLQACLPTLRDEQALLWGQTRPLSLPLSPGLCSWGERKRREEEKGGASSFKLCLALLLFFPRPSKTACMFVRGFESRGALASKKVGWNQRSTYRSDWPCWGPCSMYCHFFLASILPNSRSCVKRMLYVCFHGLSFRRTDSAKSREVNKLEESRRTSKKHQQVSLLNKANLIYLITFIWLRTDVDSVDASFSVFDRQYMCVHECSTHACTGTSEPGIGRWKQNHCFVYP